MSSLPRIISVDDHVFEPPDVWTSRLPTAFLDKGPRVVRDRAEVVSVKDGVVKITGRGSEQGRWCDWWLYDGVEIPLSKLAGSAGLTGVDTAPITFEEIRLGCWKQADRLADMDLNHVEAAVCYPNIMPRFCGQTFLEAKDKELALLCVQAYNDWIIDEWCGGSGYGRLIPVTIIPLWDVGLAAKETFRCAEKGSNAVAFSENPFHLGLPTLHDPARYWDPFLRACEETGSVLSIHIGSSSRPPKTSDDAPQPVGTALWFTNTAGALCDHLVSGTLVKFPNLKISLAEGQVGWIPYVIQRLDQLWHNRDHDAAIGLRTPNPPSTYIADRVFGCIYDDLIGLRLRDVVGMSQIMFETDYPHNDGTFPHSAKVAEQISEEAGLNERERYQLLRGNAINAYDLGRFGITQ